MRLCPNCGQRAEDSARFCRDCYTVFPFEEVVKAKAKAVRKREGGSTWKVVTIAFAAAAGAYFYQLDVDPWGQEPGSVEAAAADVKRSALTQFSRADRSVRKALGVEVKEAAPSSTLIISGASVYHAGKGCAITQTVFNGRSEPVSPIILNMSFRDAAGAIIGSSAQAVVDAVLPAGADEEFEFRVPCPQSFATVHVEAAQDKIKLAQGPGGSSARAFQWILEGDADISCPADKLCPVKIRFASGETATYAIRDGEKSKILVGFDEESSELLEKSSRATLELPASGGGVRMVPIERREGKWIVPEKTAARRVRDTLAETTQIINTEVLS